MSSYDVLATGWVNSFSGTWRPLDLVLMAMSMVGAPAMILAVALRWWSRVDRARERHAAVAAGLSFILGLTLNQILLLFAHRVRPYDAGVTHLLIAPSRDPSFPSDHATAAFSIVFAFLLQKRFLRAFLFSLVGALLVISRVYLGIHYVGDIVGGMLTALIAASVVPLLYREGTAFDRRITGIL
jgi:undecaprenyl-diphosphatase